MFVQEVADVVQVQRGYRWSITLDKRAQIYTHAACTEQLACLSKSPADTCVSIDNCLSANILAFSSSIVGLGLRPWAEGWEKGIGEGPLKRNSWS